MNRTILTLIGLLGLAACDPLGGTGGGTDLIEPGVENRSQAVEEDVRL